MLVGLVGGLDELHAVAVVEIARLLVEHVGEVGLGFGYCTGGSTRARRGAAPGRRCAQLRALGGVAAQGVDGAGGQEPGLGERPARCGAR